jgi:DNA-binding beta-propeller fold protein YncE
VNGRELKAVSKKKRRGLSVSPRALLTTVIAIILIGALAILVYWLATREDDPWQEAMFFELPEDAAATVGFAAVFPGAGAELAAPTGIATDGQSLYVALRDAGQIAEFTMRGALVQTVTVPPAEGRDVTTPIDVAVLSTGRLAVVDSASGEVILLDMDSPDEALQLCQETDALLGQPTAVTATDEMILVACATAGSIETFSYDGVYQGGIGADAQPPLTFVGGLHVDNGVLYVSDSNAGRVLTFDLATGVQLGALQQPMGLPRGVTNDVPGRTFVADSFEGLVLVFDPSGMQVLDVVGDEKTRRFEEGGALASPQGVVWDPETRFLYVTDTADGRVKVYEVR